MKHGPTQLQLDVLRAIREWWDGKKYGPTYRDLATATGHPTPSVQYAIGRLETRGLVEHVKGRTRTLRVVEVEP